MGRNWRLVKSATSDRELKGLGNSLLKVIAASGV